MTDDRRIAAALGVKVEQVSQLRRRGMPRGTVAQARQWFDIHGMRHRRERPVPRR